MKAISFYFIGETVLLKIITQNKIFCRRVDFPPAHTKQVLHILDVWLLSLRNPLPLKVSLFETAGKTWSSRKLYLTPAKKTRAAQGG